jgi:integrase
MAVYAKGLYWMGSVGAGATRLRKTFKSQGEAQAWVDATEAAREAPGAVAAPTIVPRPTVWTLGHAYDEVYRHVWRGTAGEPKATANSKAAMAFFGANTLCSEITSEMILEWMTELQDEYENSGSTCNKKLSSLSMMLTRAEEFGGLDRKPRMKRYRESKHRVRWFTDQEEIKMLNMCKHLGLDALHDFIIIGLDTGFRLSENLGLTVSDYHNGMLVLHEGETKNGSARSVPCTLRVSQIIESRTSHRVHPTLTRSSLRKQWDDLRSMLDRLADPGMIVHVLRHTCATRLVSKGVPLPTVQAWMGHKVIQTTMRYAHVVGGQLLSARDALEPSAIV